MFAVVSLFVVWFAGRRKNAPLTQVRCPCVPVALSRVACAAKRALTCPKWVARHRDAHSRTFHPGREAPKFQPRLTLQTGSSLYCHTCDIPDDRHLRGICPFSRVLLPQCQTTCPLLSVIEKPFCEILEGQRGSRLCVYVYCVRVSVGRSKAWPWLRPKCQGDAFEQIRGGKNEGLIDPWRRPFGA